MCCLGDAFVVHVGEVHPIPRRREAGLRRRRRAGGERDCGEKREGEGGGGEGEGGRRAARQRGREREGGRKRKVESVCRTDNDTQTQRQRLRQPTERINESDTTADKKTTRTD